MSFPTDPPIISAKALPELTDIGGIRCLDIDETSCMLPFLGAGPEGTPESNGYYTRADYIEIVARADELEIEVIPEIGIFLLGGTLG